MSKFGVEWNKSLLGDVCKVASGDMSMTKSTYKSSGFTAFSASGPDGFVEEYQHEGDGIVVSSVGAKAGKVFKASGKWTAIKNTIIIKSANDELDIEFLFHLLSTQVTIKKEGGAQPFISQKQILKTEIEFPPLPEQKKIVEIVSGIYKVINSYKAKEKTYKNLIQSMIDELTNGMNSKFYKLKKFGDIVENSRKKTSSDLPIYSVSIHSGMVPRNQFGRNVISELNNEGYLYARKGDLCYNMMRMWQGAAGIAPVDCLVSPAYVVCRPLSGILSEYLDLICESSYCIDQFKRFSKGITSDRWRLYFDDFSKIDIVIPTIDKQREIIDIVLNQKYLLKKCQEKHQLIMHLKTSLMDDLVLGRKRVSI